MNVAVGAAHHKATGCLMTSTDESYNESPPVQASAIHLKCNTHSRTEVETHQGVVCLAVLVALTALAGGGGGMSLPVSNHVEHKRDADIVHTPRSKKGGLWLGVAICLNHPPTFLGRLFARTEPMPSAACSV